MKWLLNRQLVLPILFGISLTTFGLSVAVLLYTMLEKDDDDDRKKCEIARSKHRKVSIQFSIPKKYVSAVIGKRGTVIKNIEQLTNTYIKMEKETLLSPECVCHISSDNMENIYSAQNMIQDIIKHLPVIETYELFVPFEASKKVFNRNFNGNRFVQNIQKSYGVKVIVDNNVHKTATGLKRKVILKGTADQITSAVIEIEDKIQEVQIRQSSEEVEIQAQLKQSSRKFIHCVNIENNDPDNDNDNVIFDYLLPYETCQRIIEKDGCIQEVEKSSGTKIIIDDESIAKNKERNVIIRGIPEQANLAIDLIENKLQEIHESGVELNCDIAMKKIYESSSCNDDSSTLNNILSCAQDDYMEVFVFGVKTPNLFWIQVMGDGNVDLQHLIYDMTEYYENEENRKLHTLKKITVGQMVAAKLKFDDKWYRAEVISVINVSTYQVFFVDYGDLEIISKNDIFELCTDMLSLRQQAIECSLANVKPLGDTWDVEIIDKFTELVYLTKLPLIAKVRGYKKRPVDYEGCRRQNSLIPCIDLYDKTSNKNIGDELIQLGITQIEEDAVNSTFFYDKCNFPYHSIDT